MKWSNTWTVCSVVCRYTYTADWQVDTGGLPHEVKELCARAHSRQPGQAGSRDTAAPGQVLGHVSSRTTSIRGSRCAQTGQELTYAAVTPHSSANAMAAQYLRTDSDIYFDKLSLPVSMQGKGDRPMGSPNTVPFRCVVGVPHLGLHSYQMTVLWYGTMHPGRMR